MGIMNILVVGEDGGKTWIDPESIDLNMYNRRNLRYAYRITRDDGPIAVFPDGRKFYHKHDSTFHHCSNKNYKPKPKHKILLAISKFVKSLKR